MIPRWLIDKRLSTCAQCEWAAQCVTRFRVLIAAPECPLKRLAPLTEEIQARAWPEAAPRASGCCDDARNYLS